MGQKSGAALGVDLYDLVKAAAHAGDMAGAYLDANGAIAATQSKTGGTISPVEPAWSALRDQLQGILGQNYVNLKDTETALRLAAADYASTDSEAKAELDSLLEDYNGRPDEDLGVIGYPTPGEKPTVDEKLDIPDGYHAPEKDSE